MPVSPTELDLVERCLRAMQSGPDGESEMMSLFADNAVFIEPFSGVPTTHDGIEAIRNSFREMWEHPVPDLRLVLNRVDADGDMVRADWTCTSPVFSEPMRGFDLFTVRDGQIVRLEIIVPGTPSGDTEESMP